MMSAERVNRIDRRQQRDVLKVVIVEPHHHALEAIHETLRQQRRLGQSWSLCHIDAHPDLACPSNGIPAKACFRPNEEWTVKSRKDNEMRIGCLYELLDQSTTGISEWILPMVLAAGLSFVEWVKPSVVVSNTCQIPFGQHKFHVGAVDSSLKKSAVSSFIDLSDEASVKVDLDCLYYRDDDETDFYSSPDSLLLPQLVELDVVDWADVPNKNASNESMANDQPWILDICLDYFYCVNPFLADIESIDDEVARVTHEILHHATFYHPKNASSPVDRHNLLCFRLLLVKIFNHLVICEDSAGSELCGELVDLVVELQPFLVCQTEDTVGLLTKWKNLLMVHDQPTQRKLLGLVLESLPHLMLPHTRFNNCQGIENHVDLSMKHFDHGLRQKLASAKEKPFLITIARSMHDGFTSENLADSLQKKVLDILHEEFCGRAEKCNCSDGPCHLEIVYDYDT